MFDRAAWKPLDETAARAALVALLGVPAVETLPVTAEVARLPFYRRWQLLRLRPAPIVPAGENHLEPVYALWRPDREPLLLEGEALPVHEVNEDESLDLTEKQVPAYIRWFFAVLRVEGRPFVLFEKPSGKVAAADREAASLATPLMSRGRSPDGFFLYDAVVAYAGQLFASKLVVKQNGVIEMTDDDNLLDEFPESLLPQVPDLGVGPQLRTLISTLERPALRLVREGEGPVDVPSGDAGLESDAFETIIDLSDPSRPTTRTRRSARSTVSRRGAGRSGSTRASGKRLVKSARPVILELVELLLERALRAQARNRLLELFNASLPTARPLKQFAELMASSSPVVIVETTIPFVEEPISEIVNAFLPPPKVLDVHRAQIGVDQNGQEAITDMSLPQGPGLALLPLQVYGKAMQVERLAFQIVARDLAAIITCTRFGDLPESLRRHTDLVLRLPAVDPMTFETLFERIFGRPPKRGWRRGGSHWVKYVLHTDFEHPRRMNLDRDAALEYIRAQVLDRVRAIEPSQAMGLKELHGLGEAREFAEDLIADIHAAIAGKLDWSQVDRGALLVGAPGTGKTTLARAIARDCGVRFIQGSASNWMAQGVTLGPHIQAIRKTFTEARDYAPSILFIDEIDSIGSREQIGGDNNSVYQTEVINAVLEQIQGLDPSAPVFVIGATNHEDRVDPALRRSGRLDRVIRIPRPNSESLDLIYQHYLRSLGHRRTLGSDVDTKALGGLSVGLTGADVERIVRGAARRARKAARRLAQADLIAEVTNKPRGIGAYSRLTPEDLERTAVHEAGHALASFLGRTKGADIGFVTIVPRDDGTLGFVAHVPDERVHLTRRDFDDRLDVFLAGRAAEELVYGADEVSTGAGSDLESATALAIRMVTRLGLGGNGRLLWVETGTPADLGLASEALSGSYERVLAKLQRSRPRLDALVGELAVRQELRGDEVRKILRRRPPNSKAGPPRRKKSAQDQTESGEADA